MRPANALWTAFIGTLLTALGGLQAAQPQNKGKGPKGPVVKSPEVKADRSIVFRVYAPKRSPPHSCRPIYRANISREP